MKYYGAVGYSETVETKPSVWEEVIAERYYYGDVLRNARRWDSSGEQQNDNIRITNQFSILADPYAFQNTSNIKYITYKGIKWKVVEVTQEERRLILTVGEKYNERDENETEP